MVEKECHQCNDKNWSLLMFYMNKNRSAGFIRIREYRESGGTTVLQIIEQRATILISDCSQNNIVVHLPMH